MSLAAAKTKHSYSSLLYNLLKTDNDSLQVIPYWEPKELPLNLEELFRKICTATKTKIEFWEWPKVLLIISKYIDEIEQYYEKGLGRPDIPYTHNTFSDNFPHFHNVSIFGFDVWDSYNITPALSKLIINSDLNSVRDNLWSGPSQPVFRTALKVLNPTLNPEHDDKTQIDWLKYHAENVGVKNVVFWQGNNNALGAVITMKLKPSQGLGDLVYPKTNDLMGILELLKRRASYNVYHINDFKLEYELAFQKLQVALQNNLAENCTVFVPTIPHVTIVPLAKGLGKKENLGTLDKPKIYFEGYSYFPYSDDKILELTHTHHLSKADALFIDETIDAYNDFIEQTVKKANSEGNQKVKYMLVPICDALDKMALIRNAGKPTYSWPSYFAANHVKVDTRYYKVDSNSVMQEGGIFSLDGVHPTVIGHALVAEIFHFVATQNKSYKTLPAEFETRTQLPDTWWQSAIDADTLFNQPIPLIAEIFKHSKIKELLLPTIMNMMNKRLLGMR
jgi:hypothetical protein